MDKTTKNQKTRRLLKNELFSYLRDFQNRPQPSRKPGELLQLPGEDILNLMEIAFLLGVESVETKGNSDFDEKIDEYAGDLADKPFNFLDIFDDDPQKTKTSTEVEKEDDIYYQGGFWIKGDSVDDIKCGRFTLIGAKFACDYQGKYIGNFDRSKSSLTHRRLWGEYAGELADKPFNYLPCGRVGVYDGKAYINMNSLFNAPEIIDAIIERYHIGKLDIQLSFNDTYQGSHYDFLLK